jgi:predicted negative regulator of RcsB-dependent stress response
MAYDLEEQERIAAIQDWWEANRWYVIGAFVALLLAVGGYKGYEYLRLKAADDAAAAYAEVEKAVKDKDTKKVLEAAAKIQEQFPKAFAASKAGLMAAKTAFDSNDLAGARKHLEWVAEKGDLNHRPLARVRLAALLTDEKRYDDALKQLESVRDEAYAALVAEAKGDVFFAQGRTEDARAAYRIALDKADQRNPVRGSVEPKYAGVGGSIDPLTGK